MDVTSKEYQSFKLKNYYKFLKTKVSKQYNTKSVVIFANSENYPNTVSLPLEGLTKDVIVLVKYTSSESSKVYAISPKDLMPILDNWNEQGNKILCDSRCVNVNEVGNLIRVPFDAIPAKYLI